MNSSDNPPDYNPDIINNQLITTFGTTTAPNNFAFGSVNVRPTPQQHLEHTFNTTDLTQEAIELAIDDAPGLDVHTVGINQEQIVGNGAPINESALTIINWGKYRLRTLGLHQIATADNSNNWVVPALMEVSIPLIQNQIINHSGTYRIVQRTVQGETGLVIEEYIPEPEPNINTRAMIIDEEENDNGEIILRGQSNVRGLPDPTGEAIEGNFNINIPPPTITNPITNNGYYKFNGNNLISGTDQNYNLYVNIPPPTITNPVTNNGYYKFNGNNLISGTNQNYNLYVNVPTPSNVKVIKKISPSYNDAVSPTFPLLNPILTKNLPTKNGGAYETVILNANTIGVIISEFSDSYQIQVKCNRNSNAIQMSFLTNFYYATFDISNDSHIDSVAFYDNNNQFILALSDRGNDLIASDTYINKSIVTIDL